MSEERIVILETTDVATGQSRIMKIGNLPVPMDYHDPQWAIPVQVTVDDEIQLRTPWRSLASPELRGLWDTFTDHQRAAIAATLMDTFIQSVSKQLDNDRAADEEQRAAEQHRAYFGHR